MKLEFFISKRYLFAKKNSNLVNIISALSVLILSIITAAIIVILSVVNGLEGVVKSFFGSFDPDIKITVVEGKTFALTDSLESQIASIDGVLAYSAVLEENVMLEYNNKQDIARIKGVSKGFAQTSNIDSVMINGDFSLKNNSTNFAVLGYGLAARLGVNINTVEAINILAPKRDAKPSLGNTNIFNIKSIYPVGVFSVLQEGYDSELIIVPIEFCRKLLEYYDEVSAIDIKINNNAEVGAVQQRLKKMLGKTFVVKNRYEQHEMLFKIMESEKWVVFLILSFVIIIASFNLTGSLTMLIIDKKDDIVTLQNMGANNSLIKRIFLLEGWLISILGSVGGLLIGTVICWLQIQFGFVGDSNNIILSEYPVQIQFWDYVFTFLTVIIIGFAASWYPVRHITKKHLLMQ